GAGTQVSQISSQVLKGMGDNMNQQITKQSLDILEKQNIDLKPSDIQSLTHTVKVDNEKVNKISSHQEGGNGPFLMFMTVWMGSIIISVLLFFAFRTSNNIEIYHSWHASLRQIANTIVTAFVCGSVYIYYREVVLGLDCS